MMAWKIRLATADDNAPRWPAAVRRFAFGLALAVVAESGLHLALQPGGLARVLAGALLLAVFANFAWILFDPRARSLQDLASRTRILRS
jgi:uncharacterized RDD family membrane protein YckC